MIQPLLLKIKNWINNYKLSKQLDKEINENINIYFNNSYTDFLLEDKEQKYHNGSLLIRQKVKEKVDQGLSHEEAWKSFGDELLTLSTGQDDKRVELLKNIYVYKDTDIKSEADKIKMIDKRIADYKRLHNHKAKRELSRKIREAELNGDVKLADQLFKEWNEKYG